MNPINLNDPGHRFENDKRSWDEAILCYSGNDPLDLWFNYICWLEQNRTFDNDNSFRKTLEQCLSKYENHDDYKQDMRMVKLWMKFIDMQQNPLNLYQILYQRGIGTQCSCFYIGWAHYYDAANAFKQAESIYNLGVQVKAQPLEELQEAQNKFRLSLAQRMLYNDASSKKRSASTLVEQRQQITSLSPPNKKIKSDANDFYQQNQQQPQQFNQNQNYYQPQQSPQVAVAPPQSSASSSSSNNDHYFHDKQPAPYYNNNQQQAPTQAAAPQPQIQQPSPQPQQQQHQPQQPQPHEESYNQFNASADSENLIECNLNNSAYVISSSLNYVYDDTNTSNYAMLMTEDQHQQSEQPQQLAASDSTLEYKKTDDGIQLPSNFVREAKNNNERWMYPICLEEPYDPNRRCLYPKQIVYPDLSTGQPTVEYSLEEIRARQWYRRREELKERRHLLQLKQQQQQAELERQRQYRLQLEQEERSRHMQLQYQQQQLQQQQQQQLQQQQQQQLRYQEEERQRQLFQQQQQYQQNYQYQQPQSQPSHQQPQPSPSQPTQPFASHPSNNFSKPIAAPTQKQFVYEQPQQTYQQQPQYTANQYNYNQTNFQQTPATQQHYQQPQQSPLPPQIQSQNHQPVVQPQAQPHQPIVQEQLAQPPKQQIKQPTQQYNNCDDFEEQIEASTIRFSTSTENGSCKSKTITIKFKKEKTTLSHPQASASKTSEAEANNNSLGKVKKSKKVPSSLKDKDKSRKKEKSSKKSKYSISSTPYDDVNDSTLVPHPASASRNQMEDANLLLSLSNMHSSSGDGNGTNHNEDSSYSYSSAQQPKNRQLDRQYLHNDEDSYSNSEFNTSFSNISFAGDNSNGGFHFGGSSCSTPVRNTATSSVISKTSTPIGTFNRYLKKLESNMSIGQNDDSMCSYTGEQNSFFQTENDEEAKRRRLEKALNVIDTHLAKEFIDPFSTELCRAFLTKIDFPTRENGNDYKIINTNLPKLTKTQVACLGGTTYHIEKEVGRGSYGSVFRAVNAHTGSVVAIKYQKPPNTWELYICTEVKKRMTNHDILPGFMDICSAVIAPNASILVSEFSQYGSLLDINNRLRTATTKVMHESLVMHFSSQILNIIDYLHSCKIVHADIKPDNFLLMKIPAADSHVPTLRLIDFGCAIDMNFFEPKKQFKKVIQTDGFTCTEMQEGRPWSYQTDLFCVAGTIHVMLFGEYMQLSKKFGSEWDIKQKFPRYLKKHVWSDVFLKLLNIKDIDHLPNLQELKESIDNEAYNMESELVKHIRTLSNLLKQR